MACLTVDVHVLGWDSAVTFVCGVLALLPEPQELVQLHYYHPCWICVCLGLPHDGYSSASVRVLTIQVPALYINFRLHSVAHMPRRAMVYKCTVEIGIDGLTG